MNNNQKCLFNCMNEVMKLWYDKIGNSDHYDIQATYSSITFYTNHTSLGWEFLEGIKDITDKKSVSWQVGVSTSQHLYIKLTK